MKIWISYTSENIDFVYSLKEKLYNANFEVIDHENGIIPGDNVADYIYQSILSADILLAIIPLNEVGRSWFYYELGLFTSQIQNNNHKKIIPILLDNKSCIPSFLIQYQYLDLTNNNSTKQLEKLIEILNLLNQKDFLLKKEQSVYKTVNRQRQITLYITLIATIMSVLLILLSIIFASGDLFSFTIDKNIMLTVTSTAIAIFVGTLVSIIFEQLRKK